MLPGKPLSSGFRMRPAQPPLSAGALRRVMEKLDSSEAARRRAAADAITAVIAGARVEVAEPYRTDFILNRHEMDLSADQ